jgi:hypothetical protein
MLKLLLDSIGLAVQLKQQCQAKRLDDVEWVTWLIRSCIRKGSSYRLEVLYTFTLYAATLIKYLKE